MEITKYSEWVQKISEEPLEVDAESFEALFDKRDRQGKTPNEYMHNFLRAYTKAVKEIAEKENHFPILADIEKFFPVDSADKGQRKVDNLKRRFIENTKFFREEEGKKNQVHLIPNSLRFKDESDKYSDLIFNFENGEIKLPELKTKSVNLQKESVSEVQKIVDAHELYRDVDKQIAEPKIEPEKPWRIKYALIFGLIALILITFVFLLYAPLDKSALKEAIVVYRIYDSSDIGGDFLMFELSNPNGADINLSVFLPPKVISSIVVEKGPVSINQFNNTIDINSDKDAKVKMYASTIDIIPLTIIHNYRGNPDAIVISKNNNSQTRGAERFQWTFEYKKSNPIEIRIEQ